MVEKSMELLLLSEKRRLISSQRGISTSIQRKRWSAVELEDVPDEIMVEIFLRLPSESVHRLRSVSNKLCKIVGNRLFGNLHMLSTAAAAAEVPRLIISIGSYYPKKTAVLQLMNYDTNTASFVGGNVGSDSNKKVLNYLGWSNVRIQCVFRNLFCFANEDHPHYCFLFNPLPLTGKRGEVLVIPSIPIHWKPLFSWYGMGMGFDANIKIVGISHEEEFAAYIYELGSSSSSSSWRPIPSVPSKTLYPMGVSVFGNMFYWLAYEGDFIISFDFNREEFGTTPRPSLSGVGPFHLVNFQGSLAAVNVKTPSDHIEIWVLTHPNNKEWTLNYRIERDVCFFDGPNRRGRLKHCGEWEHGLFFVEFHERWGEWWSDAIFLDLRCSGSIKRVLFSEEFDVNCRRFQDAARLFSFTGSVVSLNNYGNLLEPKEDEWCIGKPITD